jgi:hypothetical protein
MPKPAGSIDQQLVAIMLAEQEQFRTHREEMGGARLGGEIQAWTVTPEGISPRVIYRFPDYEATLHAGAAVAQRIIRGDEVVDVAAGLVPVGEMRAAGDDARGAASAQGVTRAERRRQERAARKAARRAA